MSKILAAALLALAGNAFAGSCGYPPYPPYGTVPVCVCDATGASCHWVFVSK